jgi:hypothetical protein
MNIFSNSNFGESQEISGTLSYYFDSEEEICLDQEEHILQLENIISELKEANLSLSKERDLAARDINYVKKLVANTKASNVKQLKALHANLLRYFGRKPDTSLTRKPVIPTK